jgi:TIR domain
MLFLSYASDDRERVAPFVDALQRAGLDVWWDRLLNGGTRFADEIELRLSAAQLVVVCWSRHAIASDWVRDEADWARQHGKLYSLRLDADLDLPLSFNGFHALEWDGSIQALDEIVADVQARLDPSWRPARQPTSPPPVPTAPSHSSLPERADASTSSVVIGAGAVITGSTVAGRDVGGVR